MRYPGGCFAPFYRWKVGLLEPDERPPLATPPRYCAAVAGGVNAYTDGFVENGLGIDDFLALCAEVGLLPAITVRLQIGDELELTEAEELVEYCNGDAVTTKFGRLRAARGHPEPYRVEHWYLGNEISLQQRYPEYPSQLAGRPPPDAHEYAKMLSRLAPRMLAASPSLPLKLLTVASDDATWNAAWAAAVGSDVFATSFHGGYYPEPEHFTAEAVSSAVQYPRTAFVDALQGLRAQLVQANCSHIAISADEWGLGPPWLVRHFGVAHAIYAASFLSSVMHQAPILGVSLTNYFEPVNEGAVWVAPFEAGLTPVGRVMALYSRHQRGWRIPSDGSLTPLDATVTMDTQRVLTVTVVHLDATDWEACPLTIDMGDHRAEGSTADVVILRADGYNQTSTLVEEHTIAAVAGTKIDVIVPPFSVLQMTVKLLA